MIYDPLRGKQRTYSVDVFLGSVATQLRRGGGKLYMRSEAVVFGIWSAETYKDRIKLL